MSAGNFPVGADTENGKKLTAAAMLVSDVIESLRDEVYDGADGQFDNSASDGGSLALLRLAAELIGNEVRK